MLNLANRLQSFQLHWLQNVHVCWSPEHITWTSTPPPSLPPLSTLAPMWVRADWPRLTETESLPSATFLWGIHLHLWPRPRFQKDGNDGPVIIAHMHNSRSFLLYEKCTNVTEHLCSRKRKLKCLRTIFALHKTQKDQIFYVPVSFYL